MSKPPFHDLSKRERQVMDIVFRAGSACVNEVFQAMPDAPSYNAVRQTMTVLVEKGELRFKKEGRQFVYRPVRSKERTRVTALQHLVTNLFDGSTTSLVSALLSLKSKNLDDDDYEELTRMIEEASRRKGK